MTHYNDKLEGKTALITGAARRIGADIARALHGAGMNVVLHYHRSQTDAQRLADELNGRRPASTIIHSADLADTDAITELARAASAFGQISLLVNNASAFFPNRVGGTSEAQWNDLMDSNLKGPYFLIQESLFALKAAQGSVINLLDIYAERPLKGHTVYCAAKAALASLTRGLAKELAPAIRVNGIAPGAILWPENEQDGETRRKLLASIPLEKRGQPSDIADAVLYLACADYVTGEILHVDGGRNLH